MATTETNVYTDAQLLPLIQEAVTRETASLTQEKQTLETAKATLEAEKAVLAADLAASKARVDVLEVEKADALKQVADATQALDDFKTAGARATELAEKKASRTKCVQESRDGFPDGFFTEERAERWAAMSDEEFASYVDDLKASAPAVSASAATLPAGASAQEIARESAAFAGGKTPTTAAQQSSLRGFLDMTRGRGPSA